MTPLARRPPSGVRIATLLASVVILAGACGQSVPSPSASPATPSASPSAIPSAPTPVPTTAQDPAEVYAAIEPQVRAIRSLEAKAPVDPKVLDDAGIKKFVADSFKEDNPPEVIEANERMLKLMGLIEPDASLGDLYIDLLGSQVAGLYSPDDKQLYVVSKSGALGPTEKTTFAHEYTHALQDQNF